MSAPGASPPFRAYAQLHIAVVLYGFTAILGRLISLPGTTLTWYRMAFTLLSLCLIPGIWRAIRSIPIRDRWYIAVIGCLMALHWGTFFEAIKYANVSITLSCLASTAFFTSLLEPWLLKRPFYWYEPLLGLIVIGGLILISFYGFAEPSYLIGVGLSIVSAMLIALASVMNKRMVASHDIFAITAIEFAAGVLLLSLLMPVYLAFFPTPYLLTEGMDLVYLLILSLLCTTFAYTLTMRAMKKVSAFTAMLAMNLEPIYGMVMAYFFFREDKELTGLFYLGAFLILSSVLIHPWLVSRFSKKDPADQRPAG
ncbi:MAG: DMT family transporter [Bacteroidota bacterium]